MWELRTCYCTLTAGAKRQGFFVLADNLPEVWMKKSQSRIRRVSLDGRRVNLDGAEPIRKRRTNLDGGVPIRAELVRKEKSHKGETIRMEER